MSLAVIVITATFAVWLFRGIIAVRSSPLARIPNAHFSAPYSRIWILWTKWRGQQHPKRLQAHKRLGPLIRIGPQELSVNIIDGGVQNVYGGAIDKPNFYSQFDNYGLPVMFSMKSPKQHAERRRMLSNVYSKTSILSSNSLGDIINTVLNDRLYPHLRNWSKAGDDVEIMKEAKAYGMDVLSAHLFGIDRSSNLLNNEQAKNHYISAFQEYLNFDLLSLEYPRCVKFLSSLSLYKTPELITRSRKVLEQWCFGMSQSAKSSADLLIRTKQTPTSSTEPVVYTQLRKSFYGSDMSPDLIDQAAASEMMDHLLAGHETTAITLTYTMHELSKRPELQRLLREELRSLSDADRSMFNPYLIDELPTLDSILKETLRFYPAVKGPFPRVVPASGMTIADYKVPGNTIISASPYTLNRNEVVFSSPDEWLPSRWIDADVEKTKDMNKWLWTFTSGRRMCIGNFFAMRSKFHNLCELKQSANRF